jgi:hypothetical protein
MRGRSSGQLRVAAAIGALMALRCRKASDVASDAGRADPPAPIRQAAKNMGDRPLLNRFAYIPPECWTKTRDRESEAAKNPCFPCHVRSDPPNYADDGDLQLRYKFPEGAASNPWLNLFSPPVERVPHAADEEVLAYVRRSNYFDDEGGIALARSLVPLAAEWDGQADGKWDGFVPDAWFRFDDAGFDRAADGSPTGWRAFAYAPFVGTFFPTNGSADDVLIRLDPSLREDESGHPDREVYVVNLAIVEALVRRADVAIDEVDEARLGVDLDLDGTLSRASRVVYDGAEGGATRMHYVGRARLTEPSGSFPIAPGLFPLGTEFLHSVRYLDVGADGTVTMAPRMKELRYAKKVLWFGYADLKAKVDEEVVEVARSRYGARTWLWGYDRGIHNGQGWFYQGFIESADGALRPQSYEETVACMGCHGGIGATTDGTFSFARKLEGPRRGWFHWTSHDLRGLPEPRRRDGSYEYTAYLKQNLAADDLRENAEAKKKFVDDRGALRETEIARLHADISQLLLPSGARALELDRAYWAVVREQSFTRGRDAVLAPSTHVHTRVAVNEKTGIAAPAAPSRRPFTPR